MNSLHLSILVAFPLGTALGVLRMYTDFPYYLAIPCYLILGAVINIGCRIMLNKATKNKHESR